MADIVVQQRNLQSDSGGATGRPQKQKMRLSVLTHSNTHTEGEEALATDTACSNPQHSHILIIKRMKT